MNPQQTADRALAVAQIEQLVYRFALAIDSRDIAAAVDLISDQADFPGYGRGPECCEASLRDLWSTFGPSVHSMSNHRIDRIDDTRATGVVYCRADRRDLQRGSWATLQLAYYDQYVFERGAWRFAARQVAYWPSGDESARQHGDTDDAQRLPESFDTWSGFWQNEAPEARVRRPEGVRSDARD